jgi:beta-lactamase regulating signal transducer with metallopeptidase domain
VKQELFTLPEKTNNGPQNTTKINEEKTNNGPQNTTKINEEKTNNGAQNTTKINEEKSIYLCSVLWTIVCLFLIFLLLVIVDCSQSFFNLWLLINLLVFSNFF